ncbi:alpha/beta hydrolase family protein [Duganella sp.]|uniref:alpha/beta hydrolase family protein n=1 Tax=Duganella sp. TaxID=1904440 RepID=UPI0031D96994
MRTNNVVLVHGAFVDGSCWEPVYRVLKTRGYKVQVAQHPATSLAADVAAVRAVIEMQDGPVTLVGHGYGGVVITEAGNHEKVAALVYIAAFVPDSEESVQTLIAHPPPGAPVPPMLAPFKGMLRLECAKFADAMADDLDPQRAQFLACAQRPFGVDAFSAAVVRPAWRARPSWYLVATGDRMIAPDAQRNMARRAGAVVIETAASHLVQEASPTLVAGLIEQAARARTMS